MRHAPTSDYDLAELTRLNAHQWQVDLLKLNPSYCSWGPHEDYMWNERGGWDSRQTFNSWKEFGPWKLDALNECVNFYFELARESEQCAICGGSGYHPDAQWVSESFYGHSITEDEASKLVESNRGDGLTTASEFNASKRKGGLMGHDAINRGILIKARLKRFGIPLNCSICEGLGSVFTAPSAYVNLVLWWLHPRKGCSRGIEVSSIQQMELPEIFSFLRAAADRNAARFQNIP